MHVHVCLYQEVDSEYLFVSQCAFDRVAILTFHLALINNPQQALVVLSFASLLYHGSWNEGVRFARQHAEVACIYVPEISNCSGPISDDELGERISHFAERVKDTVDVFTETASLQKTMVKFPGFPCSNLVRF